MNAFFRNQIKEIVAEVLAEGAHAAAGVEVAARSYVDQQLTDLEERLTTHLEHYVDSAQKIEPADKSVQSEYDPALGTNVIDIAPSPVVDAASAKSAPAKSPSKKNGK